MNPATDCEPGAATESRAPVLRAKARQQALWDVGAMAVVILLAALASAPLGLMFDESLAPLMIAAMVAVVHGGMFAGTVWILRRRGSTLAELGWARPERGYGRTLLLALPTLVVMWVMVGLLLSRWFEPESVDQQLPIASASPAWFPLWLVIAAVVGCVEELVFRGLLLRRLTTVFASLGRGGAIALASLVSSLAFGLLHGFEPGVLLTTAAIGLFLALVTLREGGNLTLAIVVHAAQDTVAFMVHSAA